MAVHGVFFALLYYGFAWQAKPLEMISVELWQSLPETVEAPPEKPKAIEVVQPVQPVKIDNPDIAAAGKKRLRPNAQGKTGLKRKRAPNLLARSLLGRSM